MHSGDKIEKKLKEVKKNYLAREYRDKLHRCPVNCEYNYRHTTLDSEGKEVEVGLCMLGSDNSEEWQGLICDDEETAKNCPYFTGKHTRDSIQKDFEESLDDEIIVANNYKDIAALSWVLGKKDYSWDLTLKQRVWLYIQYYFYVISEYIYKIGLNL